MLGFEDPCLGARFPEHLPGPSPLTRSRSEVTGVPAREGICRGRVVSLQVTRARMEVHCEPTLLTWASVTRNLGEAGVE